MEESIKAKGQLKIEVFDQNGVLKEVRNLNNLVVNVGLTHLAARAVAGAVSVMSHMAVGTSATTPSAGDTTLGGELARVALTSYTSASNVITAVATFGAGIGTGGLQEAGIFNATPAGTMLSRTTYAVLNKGASDSITVTWSITIQ